MSISYDEFKPMITAFSRVYGKTLSTEAVKVWYRALRGYSRQAIARAFNDASMSQRVMPTPNEVQAITREEHRQVEAAKYKPFSLADIKPATAYGHACLDVIQQILAGDLSGEQGLQIVRAIAVEMGATID